MSSLENNGDAVQHFRDLKVYQRSFECANYIYKLTKTWPSDERYSLIDQIRRSSRSVSSNIAEAWRKRRYPAHFVSKLSDADSEIAESQTWIDFAHKCGYMSQEDFAKIDAAYERISGGIVRMMAEPEKWCFKLTIVKEDVADYDYTGISVDRDIEG